MLSGVRPLVFWTFISTPCASRTFNIPAILSILAMWAGVFPFKSCVFTSAPRTNNLSTILVELKKQASCSVVIPVKPRLLMSALWSNNRSAVVTQLVRDASSKAVFPSILRASTVAPSLINSFTDSTWFSFVPYAAKCNGVSSIQSVVFMVFYLPPITALPFQCCQALYEQEVDVFFHRCPCPLYISVLKALLYLCMIFDMVTAELFKFSKKEKKHQLDFRSTLREVGNMK